MTALSSGLKIKAGIAIVVVLMILGIIATAVTMNIVTVHGNEIGVKETWANGTSDETLGDKTHFIVPGWSTDVYKYDLRRNVFEVTKHTVRSSDNQDMTFTCQMQWRFDPTMIVDIHKEYRAHIKTDYEAIMEENLIKEVVLRIINTLGTQREAIEAYSGVGFKSLQTEIAEALSSSDEELRSEGIIVENFVISSIELESDFIKQIQARQVATQKELRAKAEEQAALAEAQKAKAEAQADYERQVVEAEREKQKIILAAEAEKQKQVLEAEAVAEQRIIDATAEKEAAILREEALVAIGRGEAEALRLQFEAYSEPGAENYVNIQVAQSAAEAFGGIQGYLPSDMTTNLITGNWLESIRSLMNKTPTP